jgi:hypothetical protein
MISHKHKCIFIHIPKSGGTSIEDIIWPSTADRSEENLWGGLIDQYSNKHQTGGLQHLLASQVKQEVGEEVFSKYYKFTFVRNPWDKAVSQYSYLKGRNDLRKLIGIKENAEFKTYLDLIQKTIHVQWMPQSKFFLDNNGEKLVDFVGKLEDFDNNVHDVLDTLNIRKGIFQKKIRKIPHSKKSSRTHYSDYYDKESKELVENIYGQDIELLGYSFE